MPSPPPPTMKKEDSLRKINKPLMERRRRERINNCLSKLKHLVVDAVRRESTQISKLEKADILEMTVSYLQTLQHQPPATVEPEMRRHKYRAGFSACTSQVMQFLDSDNSVSDEMKSRLECHLNTYSNAINQGCSDYVVGEISPDKCYNQQLAITIPERRRTSSTEHSDLLLPAIGRNQIVNQHHSYPNMNVVQSRLSNNYVQFAPSLSLGSLSSANQNGHVDLQNFQLNGADQVNNNDNVWRPW